MNWRWFVGSRVNLLYHLMLSRPWFPLTRALPYGRSWLYDIQRFSQSKKLDTVFDVGANVGQTAQGVLQYFPSVSLHCFEPVASPFSKLLDVYRNVRNVHCIHKALGRDRGVSTIALHSNSELNSLVSNQPRTDDLTGETETVLIETIDFYCAEVGIERIDILKIDVQGWELEVLEGASTLIAQNGIRFIYAEVCFRREDSDMQHFADFNAFMESTGFWFCGLYESFRWGPNREYVGFANALYFNPKHTRASS